MNKKLFTYNKSRVTNNYAYKFIDFFSSVLTSKHTKTKGVKANKREQHKLYKKIIIQSKKYHAHDEKNSFKVGDIVKIIESKPFSQLKSWTVINENQEKI